MLPFPSASRTKALIGPADEIFIESAHAAAADYLPLIVPRLPDFDLPLRAR